MKWSDGHPFTADDILYWWEHEVKMNFVNIPKWMSPKGEEGVLTQIDQNTLKFILLEPYSMHPERLTEGNAVNYFYAPRHYLEKYHPILGDDEFIEAEMKARSILTRRGLYLEMKHHTNPEHPRLWPWLYRTYKANHPKFFVRNPYFWAVDPEGNQLPYVDRVMTKVINTDFVPNTAASGGITMQGRHIYYLYYTLLMSQREVGDYEVYHWQENGTSI